jgi:hypothetical protein
VVALYETTVFVVGDFLFVQHELDGGFGAFRLGEVVFKRRADQFIARTVGERFHLLVDVGDDAVGVSGHQGVNIGFNEGAGVELLVAQTLVEFLLLFFNLFARGVVSAD